MPTSSTELFRFSVARPSRGLEPGQQVALYPTPPNTFEVLALANAAAPRPMTLAQVAGNYLTGKDVVAGNGVLAAAASQVISRLSRLAGAEGDASEETVRQALQDSGFDGLAGDDRELADRTWSTLTALHCAPGADVGQLLGLSNIVRALALANASADRDRTLALNAPLAIPLSGIRAAYAAPRKPAKPDPLNEKIGKQQKALVTQVTVLQGLVGKLDAIQQSREAGSKPQPLTAPLSDAERKRLNSAERKQLDVGQLAMPLLDLLPQLRLGLERQAQRMATIGRSRYKPAPAALETTQQKRELQVVTMAQLSLGAMTTLLGDSLFNFGLALDLMGDVVPLPTGDALAEGLLPRVRPVGVMDLKLVETQLNHYRLGEVAHVENVLATELRKRMHEREDSVEDVLVSESESSRESERNLESTERFELQQEIGRVLNEQMQITAGVNVSAYGPGFSVGVNAGFSYGRSQQDTQRASSTYAKEVVEKSREKVETRIREQRTSTRKVVVRERNIHQFDNSGSDSTHKVGVYRYVDKMYDARLLNYGRRMMFEFLVPEPAVALRNTQRQTSAKPAPLPELTITAGDLNETNYQYYASQFGARNIEPPPPLRQAVSMVLGRSSSSPPGDGSPAGPVLLAGEVTVPTGYAPVAFRLALATTDFGDAVVTQWAVGEVTSRHGGGALLLERGLSPLYRFAYSRPVDKIPAWVLINQTRQAVASVSIECDRTLAAVQAWQSATFQKILEAFEIRLADTLEANRQLESQQRKGTFGGNPTLNRRREREELTRGCITAINAMLLQGDYFDAVTVSDSGVVTDVSDALREGHIVRFFQGAFEWDNMTYELFPYFWGKRERWPEMLMASHEDPKFEEFLRSGFARVMVPVTPGQEPNVLNFLAMGLAAVFDGAHESVVDDPEFLALLADIEAPLDPPVQEGEAWQVVVPTTLIKLQLQGEEEALGIRGTA